MSLSASEPDAPILVCQIDNVQGVVDALSCIRWKRLQDALVEMSEFGLVLVVEESGCLQGRVYLPSELFVRYEFNAQGRPRFGVSLGTLVDCLNVFSVSGHASAVEFQYPGLDMQLLLKSVDSVDAGIYAEIRTKIPEMFSREYHFENAGNPPISFTIKSAALKEAIDDLEWPGSNIQIILQPDPPCVTFKGEGHGDLQVDFMYYARTDLLTAFHCDQRLSYRYKYKLLKATILNMPWGLLKDDRGSKVTVGRGGMLKVQHLVSTTRSSVSRMDSSRHRHPSRIAYIEFLVKPQEDED